MLDLQALSHFVYHSRVTGYAAEPDNDPASARPRRAYENTWQNWHYSDLALAESGDGNVIGRELASHDGALVWGMTYYGVIVRPDCDRLSLYTFLRQAMRALEPHNLPARGQQKFTNGDYSFTYDLSGTMLEFTGVERVLRRGEPVYRLYFNGGLLKSRL